MNGALFTPSSGLLNTHVSWEQLEDVLIRSLRTGARFGPNKCIKRIGELNGFLSRIGVCFPNWCPADPSLPEEILVKFGSCLNMAEILTTQQENDDETTKVISAAMDYKEMEKVIRRFHNTEAIFYSTAREVQSSLPPDGALALPHFYGCTLFSKANKSSTFMALEFLEDSMVRHIHQNIDRNQLGQVLKALAKIQATAVTTKLGSIPELHLNPFTGFYTKMMNPEALKMMYTTLRPLGDTTAVLIDRVLDVFDDVFDTDLPLTICRSLGMAEVIVHGDLWSTNVLWKENGDLAAIVDWQMAHYGSPAEDLIRLLNSVMEAKQRSEEYEDILDEFYDYLEEYLDDREAPYTRRQLLLNYRQLYPFATMVFVPPIAPIFQFATQNTDEGTTKVGTLLEKVNGMLSDVIYFHKQNPVKHVKY